MKRSLLLSAAAVLAASLAQAGEKPQTGTIFPNLPWTAAPRQISTKRPRRCSARNMLSALPQLTTMSASKSPPTRR